MKKIVSKLLLMGLFAVLCISVFAGCSAFSSGYDIEWLVLFDKEECQNASITVEGYDVLPTKIPAGEEITFTIEGINGYKVYRVKINNRKVTPDENGKYVFTVTEKTEVEITLREMVAAVKLPDMVFYAGDVLDRKSVEAEIVYATGRTEKTNKYSVIYQNETADSFGLGDTYYTVKLSADRDNLYRIDLKQTVACKGVIDPYGGVIADSYIENLRSNTEITNLNVDSNGVISFIFTKPLTADIPLPTNDQISKGDGSDFVFNKWSGSFKAGTRKSVEAVAIYDANLVTLSSVKLEMREVDNTTIPYLVITGKFVGADNIYLYFAESSKGLELVGSSVIGNRGDSFELLFDLRETNHKEYISSWMDIELKSDVEGYVESQSISLGNYGDDFVDLESLLQYNGYSYEFQTYDGLLKLETNEYFYNGYTLSYSLNDKGEVILTISGNIVNRYAGNFVKSDIEYDIDGGTRSIAAQYCLIDKDGNYSVSFNLFDIPLGHNAYVHFWVIDSMEEENVIYVGKENNLLNEWCENTDLNSKYNSVGLITDGGIRCPNPDNTKTYFVGMGKWGGVVVYGKNDTEFTYTMDSAAIYEEDGRVLISVTGSYIGTKTQMEAELATWAYDLMENPYAASDGASWNGGWTAHTPDITVAANEDGSFVFVFDVTDIGWNNTHEKQCYTFHLGRAGEGTDGQNPDLNLTGDLGNSSVALGGKTYTIISVRGSSDGAEFWGCLGLTITK